MNSKSKYGKYWKAPITQQNLEEVSGIFTDLQTYLLSLEDMQHKPLHQSRRKTFITGFLCTFHSVLLLAKDLFGLPAAQFSYFPTFRISQDFAETLFSKIRRMGGHSNNPTSSGFKHALRSLLVKQAICASKSSNCLDCDSTAGVFALEWSKRSSPIATSEPNVESELSDKLDSLKDTGLVVDNILTYIAGYIVRSLKGKAVCDNCIESLLSDFSTAPQFEDHHYSALKVNRKLLQSVKNQGGLVDASESVFKILQRLESIISLYVNQSFVAKPRASKILHVLFNRSVYEDRPVAFFHHDCSIEEGLLDHKLQLTNLIANKYIDIRLKHFSKVFNRSVVEKDYDRSRLNRLIIFKHQ